MNSLMVIKPYLWEGMWVFDDEATGLVREALVSGVPEVIETLCLVNGIPMNQAQKGFRLIFSETPFPGHQLHVKHILEGSSWPDEQAGNWYDVVYLLAKDGNNVPTAVGMKGWLCPALFKYFDHTPKNMYVKAEAI